MIARSRALAPALAAALAAACGGEASVAQQDPATVCGPTPLLADTPDYPRGLHVVDHHVEDVNGKTVVLRGVNRSGTEYRCIQDYGFFDGPDTEASVQTIASWPNVNAVRVPLNEGCWLGIQGADPQYAGCNYKNAIRNYVALLHKYKLVPILDLHWAAPNIYRPVRLQPMPNADNTPHFWTDVAQTFKHDDGVVFEPYNEPFPGTNNDNDYTWRCWRDGCVEDLSVGQGEMQAEYQGAGMQSLVTAIRNTGAPQLILLGGVKYSNALTQWIAYKPADPQSNLAAAWHVYNYNQCIDASCWNNAPQDVASAYPIVATEVGENDCTGNFISPLLDWLDQNGDGYLAWSWNAYGMCRPAGSSMRGSPYSLISSYDTGVPNGVYAQTFHDHVQNASP